MTDDDRELGIELGDVRDDLEDEEYPIGHDELLERHGDAELGMENEETTLEDLLGPLNEDEYESFDALETAIMNMVGDEAVGRENYSDRSQVESSEEREEDEGDQRDQESF